MNTAYPEKRSWQRARRAFLAGALLILLMPRPTFASLDLGYREWGISIGNARRVTGLRLNAVDRDVERVTGVNLTLWNPGKNPQATFNGAALGLIGPKTGRLHGIGVGGLGATARQRIWGLAAGGFGVASAQLRGVAIGGILVDLKESAAGVAASGYRTRIGGDLTGLAFSLVATQTQDARGLVAGGLFASARNLSGFIISPGIGVCEDEMQGLALGGIMTVADTLNGIGLSAGGIAGGHRARGLFIAGVGIGAGKDLTGIALALGGIGAGKSLRGITLAGVGIGAGERLAGFSMAVGGIGAGKNLEGIAVSPGGVGAGHKIRGIALGGLTVLAPDIKGVATGALNGAIVEEVNLEDFLKIRKVNERFVGLSVGLINYTRNLKGVQLGLLNYAGNNPRWLRLLPLVNVHL